MTGNVKPRAVLAVPSINGAHLLERMLPSLRMDPHDVVVLDQGSTDRTAETCATAGVELMQLGRPYTYTQACNIGALLARQRKYPYLCVANNDITFATDVMGELVAEMERDPQLGVVAPSQVILDPANDLNTKADRVFWNLDSLDFRHEGTDQPALPRLEADFCEFTCALIRMRAIAEIGFLDDAYGFYHEDADFCFRLRKAGYSSAYLPRCQIYHFTSSTFNSRRPEQLNYLRRNRAYFAEKHLGYGVRSLGSRQGWATEASTYGRRVHAELRRFGLIDDTRPALSVGRIGPTTSGYLVLPNGFEPLDARDLRLRDAYEAVLAPSDASVNMLRSAGFSSFRVPAGIDPDVFHPWAATGAENRPFDETTYLLASDLYDRRALPAALGNWIQFASRTTSVRLIVIGSRLRRLIGSAPDTAYRSGRTEVSWYATERIELRETAAPPDDRELASLMRSVDFTFILSGADAGLTLAKTLACGTPVVLDPTRAELAELYQTVTGGTMPKGSGGLLQALEQSAALSTPDRALLAAAGRYGVLGHSTLRHTAMAIRHALEMTQVPIPTRFLQLLQSSPDVMARQATEHERTIETPSLRIRLSGGSARRLASAARKVSEFAEIWHRSGLAAAVSRTLTFSRQVRPSSPEAPGVNPRAALPIERSETPLLIGYIDAQLGIGQSLRGLATALARLSSPFSIYPFGIGVEGRRSVPFMRERYDQTNPHAINVIEVSPAELPNVFRHVPATHFDGAYNILRTYWELARGPSVWREDHGLDRINEIWAPNDFCARAFRDFFDGPIHIVPPCLDTPEPQRGAREMGRGRFGLDPSTFLFMFSFDYYSFPERKNPLAAVRAFLIAFAERRHPVGLLIKAVGANDHFPAVRQDILAAAELDGRISIIDGSISREDMLLLMTSIDCYVSLHRSEGFGLGMAEAMAIGKPVIATGYSGNEDFVTEQTAYPIPYTLRPVYRHEYVHTSNQVWAEPDEDACAAAMLAVVEQPQEAARRAEAGRSFVTDRYGAANVGRIAADRLSEVRRFARPSNHDRRQEPGT